MFASVKRKRMLSASRERRLSHSLTCPSASGPAFGGARAVGLRRTAGGGGPRCAHTDRVDRPDAAERFTATANTPITDDDHLVVHVLVQLVAVPLA